MTADTAHNELVEKGWAAQYRIPALDLDLFSRDGLEILNAVEQQDYNVLRARPSISKGRKIALMVCILSGKFRGRSAAWR